MAGKRGDAYQKAPETLRKAILSMKRKIEKNQAEFREASLTYEAEMGDGRMIQRGNPFVQEYRALVKDYATAIKAYEEITSAKETTEENSLGDIRAMLKIAK